MKDKTKTKKYGSEELGQHILQLDGIQLKTTACHSTEDTNLNKE
jgi:hypothetical protein